MIDYLTLTEQMITPQREQKTHNYPLPYGWGSGKEEPIGFKKALSRVDNSLCYARRNKSNSCRIEVSRLGSHNIDGIKKVLTRRGYSYKVIADGKRLIINTYKQEQG